MTINQRIESIMHEMGLSLTGFADEIGVKQQTLYNYILKDREPSYAVLKKIAETCVGVNIEWLITGEGEMFKPGVLIDDIDYTTGTPLLPVEALGGSLSGSSIAILAEQCKKYNVPISNIDYLIPIAGDSMIPSYCPGDVVGIKKVNERAFIEWGKVYVLDTCNGVVIKEVQPSENEGCVICISHNLPERYKPFEISLCPEDFYGMYAVKGTVRIS